MRAPGPVSLDSAVHGLFYVARRLIYLFGYFLVIKFNEETKKNLSKKLGHQDVLCCLNFDSERLPE